MTKDGPISKREQLELAITAQEGLRGTLDDSIIDATIAALRKELDELRPDPAVEQQRKLVTLLFMDVVNSTRLLQELDPEENLAIMDAALQRLAGPVEAFGGRVTRFMGDGFLAIFGLPRARENDPEMAVRAGLGIIETAGVIAGDLENEHSLQGFQVRVGVNTGLVVAGGITEAEGTVMGAAVNLAARLESSAPPGGVLISQNTYQHMRGIFDMEKGDPIQVKGFPEPVQVYLAKRPKPRTFRVTTRGVEGVETHMVGREREMETLQAALNHVVLNGSSRFVTVVGEAGLGKSRLVHEFESWMERQPITPVLFKGRATSESLNLPYALFRDLFAFRLGILDSDQVEVVREKVVTGFREALGEDQNPEMKAHFVGQLLGYDFHKSNYLESVLNAPQQLRNQAMVYLSDYIKALVIDDPVVLFLDDIHWADESSLDIILQICQELADQPILYVALTRASLFDRQPSWGQAPFHERIVLQSLSPTDSRRLVSEVLQKVQDMPARLRDVIIGKADGNPFYLEELIKMLVEDGVIIKGEPNWRVHPERLVSLRIPPTLTGVIQARLDSLPVREKTVLQQASVVGRRFWDTAVQHLNKPSVTEASAERNAQEARETEHHLDTLQARELIYAREVSAFSDTAEYLFKHAILRDVTYESVLKRMRRVYHAMIADWLIRRSGERAGEVTGLIAGHLEKAGKRTEALEYLCQAAEAATANYAINEAADFYARALALTPEGDLERQYDLLLGQEKVLSMQGSRDKQRETLEVLAKIAEALADERKKAELYYRWAWLAFWIGEYQVTISSALQAATLSKAAGEPGLSGKASYAMAWAHLQLGDTNQALEHAEDALITARRSGDHRSEGSALNVSGMINIAEGDYFAAQQYLREFLAIARKIGDRERETTALNNLGVALTCLGDYQAAQENFLKFLILSRETGDRSSESTALVNLAWVTSTQGEWESARKYAEAGIAMKQKFEQTEAAAEGLIWLGHAWLGLGDPEQAAAAYRQSLDIRWKLNQPHLAMGVIAGIAQAALARDDLNTAQSHIEEILAYFEDGGTLKGTWEPMRIYLTCYQVLKANEDPRAEEVLEQAFERLEEQAKRITNDEARHQFLQNVAWNRTIRAEWEARHSGPKLPKQSISGR